MRRTSRSVPALAGGALLLLSGCTGCEDAAPAPTPPPNAPAAIDPAGFNGERALAEAGAFVALGPRVAGTDGARRAARYLWEQARGLGLAATIDTFEAAAPGGTVTFRNVLAQTPSASNATELVVLVSHYDTKAGIPGFVGANDSGSSAAVLLELARGIGRMGAHAPPVLLAWVDGEECVNRYGATDGLHGSRRLAAQLAQGGNAARVRGVLIVDMVGDSNLTVRLPENGTPALMQAVLDAATAEGARRHFGLGLGAVLDDHVPFLDAGLPAVDIIDFEYGSAPGLNDYWHTAADTVDKLSADSLRIAGRVVARAVNVLLGAR